MGRLRCWLIRGLILSVLAAAVAGGWVAHEWVSPERVREALVAALQEKFPDAEVHVGSARLRLFGGICATDVRLTRRGEESPFFDAPSAVIYHDKEQLGGGRLVIRKVELDGPTIRLDRRPDGAWSLAGLAKSGPPDAPVPTFVVRNATVLLTDHRPGGLPPVALIGARLNLVNDPPTVLKIDAGFTVAPGATGPTPMEGGLTIPVSVSAKLYRNTGAAHLHVEVPEVAFGPELAAAVDRLSPEAAGYAAQFTARVGVKADLTIDPAKPLWYNVRLDVRDGRWEGEELPWPVEQLAATVHVQDGKLTVDKGATARVGRATVEFSLETRTPDPPAPLCGPRLSTRYSVLGTQLLRSTAHQPAAAVQRPEPDLEDRLERFELTVRELALDDQFFARLPPKAARIANRARTMFSPTGTTDLAVRFARSGGRWERVVEVRPNKLAVAYEKFRYPVTDLAGWVRKVNASDGTDEFRVQLTGTAGGRRVEATGRVAGEGPDPLIDLKIAGTDLPLDDRLASALPPKYAEALRKLRFTARGDFVAEIRQQYGANRCDNTFRVSVYDGSLNYDHFPYPLAKVRGNVTVFVVGTDPSRPGGPAEDADRVELREFEATHAGGRLWIPTGGSEPVPGSRDRRLTLRVLGADCPIDADLKAAMTALKLDGAWRTFDPRGRVTFGADVEVLDRSAPDPPPAADGTASSVPSPLMGEGQGGGEGLPPSPTLPRKGGGSEKVVAAALPGEPAFDPATDLKLTVNLKGPTITPSFFPYDLDDVAAIVQYHRGRVGVYRFAGRHGPSAVGMDAAEVRFGGGEVWANVGGLTVRPLVIDPALLQGLPGRLRSGVEDLKLRGPMELAVKHLVVSVPPPPPGGAAVPAAPGTGGGGVAGKTDAPAPVIARAAGTAAPPGEPDPEPVVYWNAELRLLGAGCDIGLGCADVHGAVASVGRYEGTHLGAVVGNAWLDRATVARQPLTAAKLTFHVEPQQPDPRRPGTFTPPVLAFRDLTGTLYQGTVGGEARVVLDNPVRYRVWLTASGVRLDELARTCKLGDGAELRGLAQAQLTLENQPDPRTGVLAAAGEGKIDVPSGRMYNLPVLLPLLKLLKLQTPDQTAFEEAHATFTVRGDRVKVSQLDLIGTAVSLGGSGELDAGGDDVRFEFYTVWSQTLKRWLTTPIGDVQSLLSGSLFKIEMVKQKNGEMSYYPHMLPVVTDPARSVAERLRNRVGTGTVRAAEPR